MKQMTRAELTLLAHIENCDFVSVKNGGAGDRESIFVMGPNYKRNVY